jgi:phage shock protein A
MELAEDPKALETQRERKREQERKVRRNQRHGADLPEPVEPADDEGQTPEDQWQNSLANLCGDVLAMQSYWDKHFKGWKHFKCPSHIKTLAREAATELTSLTTAVTGR